MGETSGPFPWVPIAIVIALVIAVLVLASLV